MRIKAQRVEQHVIHKSHPCWALIDDYSFRSKNLYNYSNYLIRQEFINNGKWLRFMDVWNQVKLSDPYKDMGSNVGAATLRMLDKCWVSFFRSIKEWKKHPEKFLGRPKLPRYKEKNGRYVLSIDNIKFAIKDDCIRFSWKPLSSLNNRFFTKITTGSKLMQCRFIPRNSDYVMEVVYEVEVPCVVHDSKRIASIDLGVDNFATITNNIGLQPIVIKGGIIKSINQYYNKLKASVQSELMIKNKKRWSHRLEMLTAKRNGKLKHLMHKSSRYVIDYCVANGIDTLVCGINHGWKQEVNLSKATNQKFVSIPYDLFISMLSYKAESAGIKFVTTDESYTSGTSFLDCEESVKENYDKSRRKHRGLFLSNQGIKINADVNGSYQIMKKVFPNSFEDGVEGAGCHPLSIKIA